MISIYHPLVAKNRVSAQENFKERVNPFYFFSK